MKFNWKWAVFALVLVLLGLAIEPWTVSQSAQINAIAAQIHSGSGLRMSSHGRSVFAVLPRPHIRIYDAELEDAEGAARLTTTSLRADLDLAGLLTGRLALAQATLADAVLTLDLSKLPANATAALTQAGEKSAASRAPEIGQETTKELAKESTKAPQPLRADKPLDAAPASGPAAIADLGELRVTNGRVLLRADAASEAVSIAEAVDLQLDWRNAKAPLSLTARCTLPSLATGQGEPLAPTRIALWVAQPGKLLRGESSPLTLRVEDAAFKLNLNGGANLTPRPHFQGQVAGSAASLRNVVDWLNLTIPLPGRYETASIQGDATIDPGALAFSTLNLMIDGNSMDGTASIRLDGQRPLVSATLAGATMNFAPLLGDLPSPNNGAGQWSRDVFSSSTLGATDLDLRISASHAQLGNLQLDDAALSLILKNGRLELNLGEASAYQGQIKARAIITENDSGLDLRGTASVNRIDIAALLWDGLKSQSLTGIAKGNISFETSGESFYELANHLDARGALSIANGEVYGMDLDLAFRRLERRPLTAGVELHSGRTAFTTFGGKFEVVQGLAEIEDGAAQGERFSVLFGGRAQIAERTINLRATARHTESADAAPAAAPQSDPGATAGAEQGKSAAQVQNAAPTPLQFSFDLSGSWDDPVLTPDALSLIRRSNAAAPLLPRPEMAPAPATAPNN